MRSKQRRAMGGAPFVSGNLRSKLHDFIACELAGAGNNDVRLQGEPRVDGTCREGEVTVVKVV